MRQATLHLQLPAYAVSLHSVWHSRPHAVAVSRDPVAVIHHAQQPVMMLSILQQTQLEAMFLLHAPSMSCRTMSCLPLKCPGDVNCCMLELLKRSLFHL